MMREKDYTKVDWEAMYRLQLTMNLRDLDRYESLSEFIWAVNVRVRTARLRILQAYDELEA